MSIKQLEDATELFIKTARLIFVAGAVSLMLCGIANLIAG
jgi:hypothetical protein